MMDAREVMIIITGCAKAYALHKAIEEGINHMWTVSAFQVSFRSRFLVSRQEYIRGVTL